MRKLFMLTLAAVILSLQSFCSAQQVTVETAHFNDSETLIYPIVCTGDEAIDAKINNAITVELRDFIKGCHYAVQYHGAEIGGMYTSFEVPCNGAGNTVILSIVMTESVYYKGTAHPSTNLHALNFNVSSGERMKFNYLTDVGDGSGTKFTKENISNKLRAHAQREGIELFDDALPLKNLPAEFYFDANLHVHFIFNRYEVAPYAFGAIDVDMDS